MMQHKRVTIFAVLVCVVLLFGYLPAVFAAPKAQIFGYFIYLPMVLKQGPTPPVQDVTILNNSTTYVSGSWLYVVGEVYNNTSFYLRSVNIPVNFYNNAQFVETGSGYVSLSTLHPYEKTCFNIMLYSVPAWTSYSFEPVTYYTGGEARPNLTITSNSDSVYFSSFYRIIGQIRNDEAQPVTFARSLATLYNNAGKVVGCDSGYVNSWELLNSGQTSSFEILSMPPVLSDVASYVLQTDGNR